MIRNWYSEIVILHCMGMLMILCAHIAQVNGYYNIGELLISGVPLFFFVSGFLVGIKPSIYNASWLKKKAQRILVPYYILLVVVLGVYLIQQTESFKWKQWIILFSNMQGLTNFVFYNDLTGFYAPLSQGLGHFWFVTVIMLCYLLVPIFEKVCELDLCKCYGKALIIATIVIVQPILLFYNVQIAYFVLFFLGYLYSKNKIEITTKLFSLITSLTILLFLCRLIIRQYIDGYVLYNHYIANLSNGAIGLWLVAVVFYLRKMKPHLIDGIASWKFIVWMESIIYEVYLVHHIIIKGSWSFYDFGLNFWFITTMVLITTVVLSLLLKTASKNITSKIIIK